MIPCSKTRFTAGALEGTPNFGPDTLAIPGQLNHVKQGQDGTESRRDGALLMVSLPSQYHLVTAYLVRFRPVP